MLQREKYEKQLKEINQLGIHIASEDYDPKTVLNKQYHSGKNSLIGVGVKHEALNVINEKPALSKDGKKNKSTRNIKAMSRGSGIPPRLQDVDKHSIITELHTSLKYQSKKKQEQKEYIKSRKQSTNPSRGNSRQATLNDMEKSYAEKHQEIQNNL